MKRLFTRLVGAAVALCLATTAAYAVQIPNSVQPSRIQKQIVPQTTPQMTVPSISGAKRPERIIAPKGAKKYKFTLRSVRIEGMTVYKDASVRPLYAKDIGKTVTLAYVYGLAEKLTAKYRNDGYILTRVVVPPQTIKRGTVVLHAVEGFVHKVTIRGESGGHEDFLYRMAAPLTTKRPMNMKTLERVLLLMNDLPGLFARAVLSPAPKTRAASDVTIFVTHKRTDFSAQIDNRGTRYLGPLQMNVTAQLNSPTKHFDSLQAQIAKTPDSNEMAFGSLTYTVPLGANGTQLSLGGNVGHDVPGYSLGQFDLSGWSKSAFVQVSHPFIRSRWKNLSALLRLDYLDSYYTDNLVTSTVADRLSVLRLGTTYQFADRFVGINTLTSEISHGLGIFHPTMPGTPSMSRARGRSNFTKITAQISRLQRLTEKTQLYAAVSGQKSADLLLASEEFGVGGTQFGGAYDPSEISGEDGVAAKLELRYNGTVNKRWLKSYQAYTYYDIGKVWDPAATTSEGRIASLASAGAGVRMNFTKTVAGSLEAALPLTRPVATTHNNHARFFFTLNVKF